MRTRSGSLAAVMARVPSHPAHSGVLCICAANASSRSGPRRGIPRRSTRQKDSKHCSSSPPALQIRRLVGVRSSASRGASFNTGVGAGALVLNQARMRTRPLALLPCYSMARAAETQLLERPQWSITTAMPTATDHSTVLSAPLRSIITTTDSVTMLLAIPRSSSNVIGAAEYRRW